MNWDAVGAVSEMIGAVGVIITLIYLAVQIRHNTRAVRLDTSHNIMEEIRDMYSLMAEHDDLADLIHRAATDYESVEGKDKVRWYALNMNFMRALENSHIQWIEGALDSRVWHGVRRQSADYTKLPGFEEFWSNRKHWFSEEFQTLVDDELMGKAHKHDAPLPGDY